MLYMFSEVLAFLGGRVRSSVNIVMDSFHNDAKLLSSHAFFRTMIGDLYKLTCVHTRYLLQPKKKKSEPIIGRFCR